MKFNETILIKAGVLYLTMVNSLDSWKNSDRDIREEFENQMGTIIIAITSNKSFQKKIGTVGAYTTKKKHGKTKAQSNQNAKDFKIITEAIFPKDSIARKMFKMIEKQEVTNLDEFLDALLKFASRIWVTQQEKYDISDYIKQYSNRAKHVMFDLGFEFVNIDSGIEIDNDKVIPTI